MTQINLSIKQKETHRHREQTGDAKGERGRERDGLEVWSWQMQTITFRMDEQQSPPAEGRNYIHSPGINHNRKEY